MYKAKKRHVIAIVLIINKLTYVNEANASEDPKGWNHEEVFSRDYESTRKSTMEREITLWYNEGFLKIGKRAIIWEKLTEKSSRITRKKCVK